MAIRFNLLFHLSVSFSNFWLFPHELKMTLVTFEVFNKFPWPFNFLVLALFFVFLLHHFHLTTRIFYGYHLKFIDFVQLNLLNYNRHLLL